MSDHELAEERSVAYHAAVAEKLRREPALVDAALERLEAWVASDKLHSRYAHAWRRRLTGPFDDLLRFLVERSEEADALRQVTPFVGVLLPRERWRIWRAVRDQRAQG